jgi:flagellar motor component MotA
MNFLSILTGLCLLGWGAWASVEDVYLLWNLKVFAIVAGGTFAGAILAYRLPYVLTLIPSVTANLFIRRRFNRRDTVKELAKFNDAYRTRSMVLGEMVSKSHDGFLKEAMTEGIIPPDKLQNVLETRAKWLHEKEMSEARKLKSVARYAWVSGLIATCIGVIALLANPPFMEVWGPSLQWTSTLEWIPALSTCFMGIVYGFGFAHLVFHPVSENLKHMADERHLKNQVVAHGVALMAQQVNPLHFTEELNSYLSPFERVEWKAA